VKGWGEEVRLAERRPSDWPASNRLRRMKHEVDCFNDAIAD
jgi:hypothetical protein